MPAFAAQTVNDGQGTPAAHTFSPHSIDRMKAEFRDRASTTSAGNRVITHEVRKPASATGADRTLLGFTFPVEVTADGITKVARTSSAQVVYNFAPDATDAEKADAVAYVQNYISLAAVKAAVKANEPWY